MGKTQNIILPHILYEASHDAVGFDENYFERCVVHWYVERVKFLLVFFVVFFASIFFDCHINWCCIDMLRAKLKN